MVLMRDEIIMVRVCCGGQRQVDKEKETTLCSERKTNARDQEEGR